MNQPWQQPPMPPQQPAQPGQVFTPQPIAQAAQNNMLVGYMQQPARAPIVRDKAPDGTHVVVLLNGPSGCKIDWSQRNSQPFLLVRYQVTESTVPAAVGRQFGHVMPFTLKHQQEAIADLAKGLFGLAHMQTLIQQGVTNMQMLSEYVLRAIQQVQFYVLLNVRRNQKQLAQGISYDEAFANHSFLLGFQQPTNLAGAIQQAQAQGIQVPVQSPMAAPGTGTAAFAPPSAAAQPPAQPWQQPGAQARPPAAPPQAFPPQPQGFPQAALPPAAPQQQAWPPQQPAPQPQQAWPPQQPAPQPQQQAWPAQPPAPPAAPQQQWAQNPPPAAPPQAWPGQQPPFPGR